MLDILFHIMRGEGEKGKRKSNMPTPGEHASG